MTQDLTKITTPFGLLDAETQDAIRQAYSDNIGMQIYTSQGWIDMVVSPEWCGSSTYRIKHEPVVMSRWLNVYEDGCSTSRNSREKADKYKNPNRVCVLRIDWHDGIPSFHREEN